MCKTVHFVSHLLLMWICCCYQIQKRKAAAQEENLNVIQVLKLVKANLMLHLYVLQLVFRWRGRVCLVLVLPWRCGSWWRQNVGEPILSWSWPVTWPKKRELGDIAQHQQWVAHCNRLNCLFFIYFQNNNLITCWLCYLYLYFIRLLPHPSKLQQKKRSVLFSISY